MEKELISVIVPVYNVENYLSKCVNSILNQTYKNFELILVDDGSPDACPKICDDFEKQDDRVVVVHKVNGGLSSARNAGLDICKGEYIAFVDSDDYIEKDYLDKLYKAIKENNADLSICGFKYVDDNGNQLSNNYKALASKVYSNYNKYDVIFADNCIPSVVAWNKLYSKHIFNNIRYPEGKIHEDEFITYDIITACNKGVAVIEDRLYNYLIRQNSIMGSKKPSEKMLHAIEAVNNKVVKLNTDNKNYHFAVEQYLSIFLSVYSKVCKDTKLSAKVFSKYKTEYKKYKKHIKNFKVKIKCWAFRYFKMFVMMLYKLKK